MIFGDLMSWAEERNAFPPVLQKALEYIKNTELVQLTAGKYEIDGDDLFAVVQEISTVVKSERRAECHSKYIDVQYLISGDEEIIGFARESRENVIVENELETKDYALYEEINGEMDLVLYPGMFAIFFPSDLHRPGCSRNGGTNIKKVVVKVNKDLLIPN
ncbi:YhcH/YjgK/YiaL family protein [Paenibacillus radicis (ex Xue et al. 2023)]|uniref:YhcH/YjgK/YiaL family protein n=1 Tax=Paenibacillus radicis (ex Xue et al. 2023) TaxID=2972489 RepID=A0ABT1YV48_9BACL|nr:YhcH/YjgK/YiaL family protein [Paenibacillus radicis (ex Xue et al. 2023)]MCR8636816.1 YhcH/YjgK/YiaL family protein [Paenibacillus radicis (ex Xue et al. 2023)]